MEGVTMKKRKCPICKKEALPEKNPWIPFCGERCKKIDLGRWALGDYRIPGEPLQQDPEDEEEKAATKEKKGVD